MIICTAWVRATSETPFTLSVKMEDATVGRISAMMPLRWEAREEATRL